MSIFKRKYVGKGGKNKATNKFTIEFRDHENVERRITAFTDRAASLELERQLKRLVDLRLAGMEPDQDLNKFLESCPPEVRERLGVWGIITGQRAAAGRTLTEHIDGWEKHLKAKQSSDRHIAETVARVKKIFVECNFTYWSHIDAEKVQNWLADSRENGMSNRTSNSYLSSGKAFCAWMNKAGYSTQHPLSRLSKLNEAVDIRVDRRALPIEEINLFITGAMASTKVLWKTSGPKRAIVYLAAIGSGLRWGELKKLHRSSFNFTTTPATVTVKAKVAKNDKDATIPLSQEIGDILAEYFEANPGEPMDPALPMPKSDRGARWMQYDLEAVGIPYVDEMGRVADFHALRHSYITVLAQAGVHPRVAQALARHSDIELTMKRYTHVDLENQIEAVAKVPTIFSSAPVSNTNKSDSLEESDRLENPDRPSDLSTASYSLTPIPSTAQNSPRNFSVRCTDRNNTDLLANIWTYRDEKGALKGKVFFARELNNPLHHNGLQGVEVLAPRKGIEPLSTAPEAVALSIGLPGCGKCGTQ